MANKKISQFPIRTSPINSDILPLVASGANYRITLSGLTNYIEEDYNKSWLKNDNIIIDRNKTISVYGNYVLSASTLTLLSADTEVIISNINFNNSAQLFIDGYLLLIDSSIVNDGSIKVGIATILVGNSFITGTGIII